MRKGTFLFVLYAVWLIVPGVLRFPQYSLTSLSDPDFIKAEIQTYSEQRVALETRRSSATPVLRLTIDEDLKRVDCILEALRYVQAKGIRADDPEIPKMAFFQKADVEGIGKTQLPVPQARRVARLSTSASSPSDDSLSSPEPRVRDDASAAKPSGEGPRVVGAGEEISLTRFLVSEQTVIFDFYSEYCPPCRKISPLLARLDQQRDDLSVVKVNINRPGVTGIDWESPVVRQYGINAVPHFVVYGPDGQLMAQGKEAYSMVSMILHQQGIH